MFWTVLVLFAIEAGVTAAAAGTVVGVSLEPWAEAAKLSGQIRCSVQIAM